MSPLVRDALHRTIARTLRNEIAAGQPGLGDLLPGEHDLCLRFGSSRHTIREALRTLAREGLIERRQGAGTRVVADRPRGPYQPAMHSVDELRQYAAETVLRLRAVSMARLSEEEVALLGEPSTERWLRADGVRRAGAEVICSNRVFVHADYAPHLSDLKRGTTLTASVNEMASTRSGVQIAGVEQDIAARPMPPHAARDLELLPGATALLFIRRYRDAANAVMVWSLNWHPADSFVYRMRLDRDRA